MKRTTGYTVTDTSTGEAFAFTVTTDVTPAPGTVVDDLGQGVTVVERTPPSRPGTVWVAPYSANCAEHGWIVSRSTPQGAALAGRLHVTVSHSGAPVITERSGTAV